MKNKKLTLSFEWKLPFWTIWGKNKMTQKKEKPTPITLDPTEEAIRGESFEPSLSMSARLGFLHQPKNGEDYEH